VYGYDAVGCIELCPFAASGSGSGLMDPFLDNQLGMKNQLIKRAAPSSVGDTVEFVKDTFASAGERDIYTGDAVEIFVISRGGVEIQTFPLKID
jgi:20S proteasome subunit beta 6